MDCQRTVARGATAESLLRFARAVALAVVFLPATLLFAAPTDQLQVQSIAIAAQGQDTRVELRLTRTGTYNLFTLTDPNRVVIDLSSAALGPGALPLPSATGAVRQVRVAHRPGGSLRIVLDVAEAMQPSATFATDTGLPRLAIALRPLSWLAKAPASVQSPAAEPAPTAPAVTAASLPPVDPETPPAPPARPPGRLRDTVVVVDAGHGGRDPGAHGPSGLREKDVTLAISRYLVEQLNAQPGMRGVLTRSDDRFLGLRERMEKARSANADLFISIHADAAYNRGAQGSTVYVLSEKAATDEASRRLAARENAALIGGVELGDKDPVLASVLMDLSQNASISSSIEVGDAILRPMGRLGRLHRPSVQQAPFMVLKSPDVPSVLVETAYISNPTDEQNLRSSAHQQKLAGAILAGIQDYFTANPPGDAPGDSGHRPPTTVAAASPRSASASATSRQHVIQRGDTLSGVASRYNVSLSRLRSANGLRSDTVWVGQKLRIPRQSS